MDVLAKRAENDEEGFRKLLQPDGPGAAVDFAGLNGLHELKLQMQTLQPDDARMLAAVVCGSASVTSVRTPPELQPVEIS